MKLCRTACAAIGGLVLYEVRYILQFLELQLEPCRFCKQKWPHFEAEVGESRHVPAAKMVDLQVNEFFLFFCFFYLQVNECCHHHCGRPWRGSPSGAVVGLRPGRIAAELPEFDREGRNRRSEGAQHRYPLVVVVVVPDGRGSRNVSISSARCGVVVV